MMQISLHLRAFSRLLISLLVAVVLCSPLFAKEETIEEMMAEAERSREHQAELYAKIAQRKVEVANEHFSKGEADKAQAAVAEVVTFARKSLESARQVRKRLKQTDITLRKTSRRLADVAGTLAFEDRPAVKQAVEDVEAIRMQVLELMFGPRKKPAQDTPEAQNPSKQVLQP